MSSRAKHRCADCTFASWLVALGLGVRCTPPQHYQKGTSKRPPLVTDYPDCTLHVPRPPTPPIVPPTTLTGVVFDPSLVTYTPVYYHDGRILAMAAHFTISIDCTLTCWIVVGDTGYIRKMERTDPKKWRQSVENNALDALKMAFIAIFDNPDISAHQKMEALSKHHEIMESVS